MTGLIKIQHRGCFQRIPWRKKFFTGLGREITSAIYVKIYIYISTACVTFPELTEKQFTVALQCHKQSSGYNKLVSIKWPSKAKPSSLWNGTDLHCCAKPYLKGLMTKIQMYMYCQKVFMSAKQTLNIVKFAILTTRKLITHRSFNGWDEVLSFSSIL